MRIAHFIADDVDPDATRGIPRSVYYTTKYQAELGHDVAVFCLPINRAVEPPGVEVKSYPRSKIPFYLPPRLLKDIAAWKPDIVHLQSAYTPVLITISSWLRRQRIPYVSTPRGAFSGYAARRRWYIKYPYKWFLELPMVNRAIFVQAISDHKDILEYGVKVPIIELPNGIELEALPDPLNRDYLKERYPALQGKRVFMFFGRLDLYHKGLDFLLDAFAKLNAPDVMLVLVGPESHDYRDDLRTLVKRGGMEDRVIFIGPMYGDEKYHILSGADVFFHTSRWEAGVCHAVMEASACYLPSIITQTVDPNNLFLKYGAGVHVHLDVNNIVEEMNRFAHMDAKDLRAMGAQARKLVEEELTWSGVARNIIVNYERYLPKPAVITSEYAKR